MTDRALLTWYVIAAIMITFVVAAHGPIRDAAWEQPCRDLRAGEAIPGAWSVAQTNTCNPL